MNLSASQIKKQGTSQLNLIFHLNRDKSHNSSEKIDAALRVDNPRSALRRDSRPKTKSRHGTEESRDREALASRREQGGCKACIGMQSEATWASCVERRHYSGDTLYGESTVDCRRCSVSELRYLRIQDQTRDSAARDKGARREILCLCTVEERGVCRGGQSRSIYAILRVYVCVYASMCLQGRDGSDAFH